MQKISKTAEKLISPTIMTKLLSDAVPAIKLVDYQFLEVNIGYCRAILPLNSASSNQHGTHQALILGLAGDYTGGLALASILDGEPILGVHEITADKGMSLWLIKSDMTYLKPSVENVYIEACITEEKHEQIIKRYNNGSTILLDIEISFKTQDFEEVAKGMFRYYCKKKNHLAPTTSGRKVEAMFKHIIKTSAKLIAQLRYLESKNNSPLFIDEISNKVAGPQGEVIANRFLDILPELQPLVAGRTHDLDLTIQRLSDKIDQIVFVGVGLDFRIERHDSTIQDKQIYALDLEEMLQYRKECSSKIEAISSVESKQIQISCNFITENIAEKLVSNGFHSDKPTLFIYEGCSMYFSHNETIKIINEIVGLMKCNKSSFLWMDIVDNSAFNSSEPTVNEFLAGMAKLGEPFIYGFEKDDEVIKCSGLRLVNKTFATDYCSVDDKAIYSLYSYNLFEPKNDHSYN